MKKKPEMNDRQTQCVQECVIQGELMVTEY